MRRGDVRWCVRPDRNPRPYVILTRPEAIDGLDKLIAAPITSTVRGLASEVQVGPDEGLRHESVISLDNTTLVPKTQLKGRIAILGPAKLHEVCHALTAAISCN